MLAQEQEIASPTPPSSNHTYAGGLRKLRERFLKEIFKEMPKSWKDNNESLKKKRDRGHNNKEVIKGEGALPLPLPYYHNNEAISNTNQKLSYSQEQRKVKKVLGGEYDIQREAIRSVMRSYKDQYLISDPDERSFSNPRGSLCPIANQSHFTPYMQNAIQARKGSLVISNGNSLRGKGDYAKPGHFQRRYHTTMKTEYQANEGKGRKNSPGLGKSILQNSQEMTQKIYSAENGKVSVDTSFRTKPKKNIVVSSRKISGRLCARTSFQLYNTYQILESPQPNNRFHKKKVINIPQSNKDQTQSRAKSCFRSSYKPLPGYTKANGYRAKHLLDQTNPRSLIILKEENLDVDRKNTSNAGAVHDSSSLIEKGGKKIYGSAFETSADDYFQSVKKVANSPEKNSLHQSSLGGKSTSIQVMDPGISSEKEMPGNIAHYSESLNLHDNSRRNIANGMKFNMSTLLENESVEEIHYFFVSFHQRAKRLLYKVEEKKGKLPEDKSKTKEEREITIVSIPNESGAEQQ
eukprot:TRINITY_DN8572_c0_g1_i1.p1 TRINITY_DN8572_c0_g1~~TRINITY_DN8572_c0_g1_i1.p1  ORF type:complete len:520 (+),score=85.43 TRINITY_DN8572_c0_g1_i1:1-1560(+)